MCATVSDTSSSVLVHPWNPTGTGSVDEKTLQSWVEERLLRHRAAIERLLAAAGPRTLDSTLRAYDDAVAELSAVGSLTGLLHSVYPEKPVRDTAEALLQKISQAGVELSLNRNVYQALDQIDSSGADAATKHYLDRTLLQYRLAGVDKDDATRARIKELQDQATLASLHFGRNVQEGGKTVIVENAADLDGLPADFLEAHQPGEDGKITLTTDEPDYRPVLTYAKSAELRKEHVSGVQRAGVSGE
jgi:thimet oligopeptidase